MGKRKAREAKALREARKSRRTVGFPAPSNIVRIPDGPESKRNQVMRSVMRAMMRKALTGPNPDSPKA
jgi:hypothetical protein